MGTNLNPLGHKNPELPCDLCGGTDVIVAHIGGRDSPDLRNVICKRCGLVFISPRPDFEAAKKNYTSGDYSLQSRGSSIPTQQYIEHTEAMALARFDRLAKHLRDRSLVFPKRSLEIGCGLGSFAHHLQLAGSHVIGLDPDPSYAAFGSDRYQIDIRPVMYEEFVCKAGALDLVASFHVIEHVVSPREFLKKIHNELAPNGLLYLENPSVDRPYGGDLNQFFWSVHLTSFSEDTQKTMLESVGFEVHVATHIGNFLSIIATRGEPKEYRPNSNFSPQVMANQLARKHRKFLIKRSLKKITPTFALKIWRKVKLGIRFVLKKPTKTP